MSLFNLKIRPTIDPCDAADYSFGFKVVPPSMEVGETAAIEVEDGIGPYTWTMLSPGCAFTSGTTTVLTNSITCSYWTGDGYVRFTVTDNCGTIIEGSVRVVDYESGEGCWSGTCAAATALTVAAGTGVDVTDLQEGDTFQASGGIAPYRWRITGAATSDNGSGLGTIEGFYGLRSDLVNVSITVIDMCGHRATLIGVRVGIPPVINSWVAEPGVTPTYSYGCDDDPRWSISCGTIDKKTGLIRDLDGCDCETGITVTVDDGCSDPVESMEEYGSLLPLTLEGDESPNIGDSYSATGGKGPYVFTSDGVTLGENQNITAISNCGGSDGNGAIGHIYVVDICGETASLELRLPGGEWVVDDTGSEVYGGGPCSFGSSCATNYIFGGSRINAGFVIVGDSEVCNDGDTPGMSAAAVCTASGSCSAWCSPSSGRVLYKSWTLFEWQCL